MVRWQVWAAAALVTVAGCTGSQPEADVQRGSSPVVGSAGGSESRFVGAWRDVTDTAIGRTGDWTNKVELSDLDGDGDVDLLFANGGQYDLPGEPVPSRVFFNNGDATFEEGTRRVFGKAKALTRVVKVADLNADGRQDIVLGTTYSTQSRLYLGRKDGEWADVTRTNLPAAELSVGDLEPGDVDGDGDLDLVLADWGRGSPKQNDGGRVRLWLNDGSGAFRDATSGRMPQTLVRFSWDIELVDVDNDWDLDIAVSCQWCGGSLLYLNDGSGRFTDVSERQMPAFTNNHDFAPIDLDADGSLDLVTINDGPATSNGLGERVFHNDGSGTFEDVTDRWWPPASNTGWDDNVVVALDVDSDGDADFVVGSLDGPDRLLVNDGTGRLSLEDQVFDATPSLGTLGLAIADLDGDGLPDVVEAQGDVEGFEDERVYLGTDVLAPDTAAPVVRAEMKGDKVVARVHDNRTPNLPHEWREIVARASLGQRVMRWYGENLFISDVPPSAGTVIEVCATDAAGNKTCAQAD